MNFSATDSPVSTVAEDVGQERQPVGVPHVGDAAQDLQREVAILLAGRDIETAMARYAESGCFADRGAADAARLRMEELIRGRSASVVAQLERERGLA